MVEAYEGTGALDWLRASMRALPPHLLAESGLVVDRAGARRGALRVRDSGAELAAYRELLGASPAFVPLDGHRADSRAAVALAPASPYFEALASMDALGARHRRALAALLAPAAPPRFAALAAPVLRAAERLPSGVRVWTVRPAVRDRPAASAPAVLALLSHALLLRRLDDGAAEARALDAARDEQRARTDGAVRAVGRGAVRVRQAAEAEAAAAGESLAASAARNRADADARLRDASAAAHHGERAAAAAGAWPPRAHELARLRAAARVGAAELAQEADGAARARERNARVAGRAGQAAAAADAAAASSAGRTASDTRRALRASAALAELDAREGALAAPARLSAAEASRLEARVDWLAARAAAAGASSGRDELSARRAALVEGVRAGRAQERRLLRQQAASRRDAARLSAGLAQSQGRLTAARRFRSASDELDGLLRTAGAAAASAGEQAGAEAARLAADRRVAAGVSSGSAVERALEASLARLGLLRAQYSGTSEARLPAEPDLFDVQSSATPAYKPSAKIRR